MMQAMMSGTGKVVALHFKRSYACTVDVGDRERESNLCSTSFRPEGPRGVLLPLIEQEDGAAAQSALRQEIAPLCVHRRDS